MAEKNFRGAPFGTQTARFDVSGVHPKNKMPGTFTQTPYCKKSTHDLNIRLAPGSYDIQVGGFSGSAVDERAAGPGWKRAFEVARLAKMPHLLHKEQWELKRILEKKLGPGTYEIKDFLESADETPRSVHGICQTKERRFREPSTGTKETPGPGTYGKGGIPHAVLEEKNRKSTSTVGLLDAGSSTARSLPMVGSDLGPGRYNFESFTDQMSKKVTSLRGPYDLFTGARNKAITTGHFAVPKQQNLGPGQYEYKSFHDNLNSQHKKKHGRFGKVDQYPGLPSDRIFCNTLSQCPREITEPGPGSFNPKEPLKPPSQAKSSPGFLSSSSRNDRNAQKFFTRNFNPVGAGRYDIQKWEESQQVNGHRSAFKSRTNKPGHAMEKFLKERIRAKDVQLKDRVFIVEPEKPQQYLARTISHLGNHPTLADQQFTSRREVTIA